MKQKRYSRKAVVQAYVDVMFPAGGLLTLSGEDTQTAIHFDKFLHRMPQTKRLMFKSLLAALEYYPVTKYGHRFSSLDLVSRAKVLKHLNEHRIYIIRTAMLGLRIALTLAYFKDGQVENEIGLAPEKTPWI